MFLTGCKELEKACFVTAFYLSKVVIFSFDVWCLFFVVVRYMTIDLWSRQNLEIKTIFDDRQSARN